LPGLTRLHSSGSNHPASISLISRPSLWQTLGYGIHPTETDGQKSGVLGAHRGVSPKCCPLLANPLKCRSYSETVENSENRADWMVGPEGRRLFNKINQLAGGSPSHILRMFSYGLANPRTIRGNEFAYPASQPLRPLQRWRRAKARGHECLAGVR